MTKIRHIQNLMRELYLSRDQRRGVYKTLIKLVEEIGELSESVLLSDMSKIREELADVIAWTLSLANLYDIDVETAINEKYPSKCSKCNSNPCRCNTI